MKYDYIHTKERNKELKAIKIENIFQRSAFILGAPFQFFTLTVTMPYNMIKAGIQAKKDDEHVFLAVGKQIIRPIKEPLEDIVELYRFGTSNLDYTKAKFASEDEKRAKELEKAEADKRAKETEKYAKARGMDKIAAMISNAERIEKNIGCYNIYFKNCILVLDSLEATIYDKSKKVVLNKLLIDNICSKYLEDFIKARKSELQKEEHTKKMDSFINVLNQKVR